MPKNIDKIVDSIRSCPSPAQREYEISVEDIEPNPWQYRLLNIKSLEIFAQEIRERGQLEPIAVRKNPKPGTPFQIVFGERRWRASKLAGMKTVKATIRETSDDEMLLVAAEENIQRQSDTALDTANLVYKFLVERKSDIKEVKKITHLGEKQIKRYLRIHQEIMTRPDFLELFETKADDIDFTTLYNFATISSPIEGLKKSDKREYHRIMMKLHKVGVKKALPSLQKKFGEKKNKQTTEQPVGKQLRIETNEKGTCIMFSATWKGESPISSADRQELQRKIEAFMERIEVAAPSDDNR